MQAQILEMLGIQDKLERRIAGDHWRETGHDYGLAIIMETCEAVDHYGWKWWKATERNTDAVAMELIDIWHFYLADMLIAGAEADISDLELSHSLDNALQLSVPEYEKLVGSIDFVTAAKGLIHGIQENGAMPLPNFIYMCAEVGLDFTGLHRMYVGKNCLNVFRQEHGYASGEYVKSWGGEEDNARLAEFLNSGEEVTYSKVWEFLSVTYNKYVN